MEIIILSKQRKDFPGGPVVKNLPANTRNMSSWSKKAPHATDQLSPRATTTEPRLKPEHPTAHAHNKRSHNNKKPMHCNWSVAPLTPTRERLHTATKTQPSQK